MAFFAEKVSTALEGFASSGAKPEVARCHAILADFTVRKEERATHRRWAEEMFASMGMEWDLDKLKADQLNR